MRVEVFSMSRSDRAGTPRPGGSFDVCASTVDSARRAARSRLERAGNSIRSVSCGDGRIVVYVWRE